MLLRTRSGFKNIDVEDVGVIRDVTQIIEALVFLSYGGSLVGRVFRLGRVEAPVSSPLSERVSSLPRRGVLHNDFPSSI